MFTFPVEIRPLEESEVDVLAQHVRRPPGMHRARWELQQEGKAAYLVAWHANLPIGHVLLKWAGTTREPMASHLYRCPQLSDLHVQPEYRSRGIGSQLMHAVETLVRQRGYSQLGLSVALDNVRARSLYERRGYRGSGLGEYTITWTFIDEHGHEQPREDVCVYLIKTWS